MCIEIKMQMNKEKMHEKTHTHITTYEYGNICIVKKGKNAPNCDYLPAGIIMDRSPSHMHPVETNKLLKQWSIMRAFNLLELLCFLKKPSAVP